MRLDCLGDLVLSLPAIYSVHNNFPDANIDLVINEKLKGLVEEIPFIRKTYLVDISKFQVLKFLKLILSLRKNKYDLSIDLQPGTNQLSAIILFLLKSEQKAGYSVGFRKFCLNLKVYPHKEMKSEVELVLDVLRRAGFEKIDSKINLCIGKESEEFVRNFLKNQGLKSKEKVVGIFPGASSKFKQWPADNFVELAEKIISKHRAKILVVGSAQEMNLCKKICASLNSNVVNCAGAFDLKQLCSLIASLDLLVGNNSGPMHIAYALNTPAVIINGPSSILRWGHKRNNFIMVSKNEVDLEANYKTESAISEISVDAVFAAVERLL